MTSDDTPPTEKQPLQFSILSLLVLTTIVAVVLSVVVVVGGWIGMTSLETAGFLLWRVVFHLPIIGVWLIAAIIAVRRWNRHPAVSKLVLAAAIGYVLLTITSLLGDFWFQYLIRTSRTNSLMLISTARSILFSLGWATCLALLVIAAFRWREPPE